MASHCVDFVRTSASPIQQLLGNLDGAASAAWTDIENGLQVLAATTAWDEPYELPLIAARR